MLKNIYPIELPLWAYGMPMSAYNEMLSIYKLHPIPLEPVKAAVTKIMERNIPDLGLLGISILKDTGIELTVELEDCVRCKRREEVCPEGTIHIGNDNERNVAVIRSERCAGTVCRRFENFCRTKTLHLSRAV